MTTAFSLESTRWDDLYAFKVIRQPPNHKVKAIPRELGKTSVILDVWKGSYEVRHEPFIVDDLVDNTKKQAKSVDIVI